MNKNLLVILGLESTAIEIEETARLYLLDHEIIRVFYTEDFIQKHSIIKNAIDQNVLIEYIISFSDTTMRIKCEKTLSALKRFVPKSIIHPSAYIAKSATVNDGCYIAANSVVSSNASISKHVMINFNVTVGHDAILNEHVCILPGARISGNVTIGEGSIIGANSFVFQNLTIGKNNMIDALTSIHKSLDDNMISAARVTKSFKQINR